MRRLTRGTAGRSTTELATSTGAHARGVFTRVPLALFGAVLAALLLSASAFAAAPTYLTSFGEPKEELLAANLAVNEVTGDVYVINYGLHSVDRFSSSGQLLGRLTGAGLAHEDLGINAGHPTFSGRRRCR